MSLVQATCRQIYHETELLVYRHNEFCFESEHTMKDWFLRRHVAQRQIIRVVWLNLSWLRCPIGFLHDAHGEWGMLHGVKDVKVSGVHFGNRGWNDDIDVEIVEGEIVALLGQLDLQERLTNIGLGRQ
ncbi:hypothetical protein CC86DRAFT_140839 [Ophiobolus disseminans]|uniref:Uncharacterized protein n=1 Tax=Ophiobolus disseminans TaxID=1469910 RepID=A0A6A7AFX0_9PLEO|nr:hypothetical protein CC86DRAFT_140839 [Ophiobolus disseminans]